MQWVAQIFDLLPFWSKPDDQEAFARRERDLKRRLDRLSQEVDVIQRAETPEDEAGC